MSEHVDRCCCNPSPHECTCGCVRMCFKCERLTEALGYATGIIESYAEYMTTVGGFCQGPPYDSALADVQRIADGPAPIPVPEP